MTTKKELERLAREAFVIGDVHVTDCWSSVIQGRYFCAAVRCGSGHAFCQFTMPTRREARDMLAGALRGIIAERGKQ